MPDEKKREEEGEEIPEGDPYDPFDDNQDPDRKKAPLPQPIEPDNFN